MNPLQFVQMMKNGMNPKQMVLNMLQSQGNNNPVMANLLQCAQQGDTAAIENIARNICKEKGVDFDQAFTSFRQQLGL